jgi:hypothetical protein
MGRDAGRVPGRYIRGLDLKIARTPVLRTIAQGGILQLFTDVAVGHWSLTIFLAMFAVLLGFQAAGWTGKRSSRK